LSRNEKKWTEMNDQERKKVDKIVQTRKKVTKPDKKVDKIVQNEKKVEKVDKVVQK
jgi:predicted Fe-S protein YdhL (DUF1289 family)